VTNYSQKRAFVNKKIGFDGEIRVLLLAIFSDGNPSAERITSVYKNCDLSILERPTMLSSRLLGYGVNKLRKSREMAKWPFTNRPLIGSFPGTPRDRPRRRLDG
jgi:hypothetical protein